jgi:hypothetical protein
MRRINSLYQHVLLVRDQQLFLANITRSESTSQTAAHKVLKNTSVFSIRFSSPNSRSRSQYTISCHTVLDLDCIWSSKVPCSEISEFKFMWRLDFSRYCDFCCHYSWNKVNVKWMSRIRFPVCAEISLLPQQPGNL